MCSSSALRLTQTLVWVSEVGTLGTPQKLKVWVDLLRPPQLSQRTRPPGTVHVDFYWPKLYHKITGLRLTPLGSTGRLIFFPQKLALSGEKKSVDQSHISGSIARIAIALIYFTHNSPLVLLHTKKITEILSQRQKNHFIFFWPQNRARKWFFS